MKKLIIAIAIFTVLFTVNTFAAEIYINNKNTYCEGIILNNRVMVPVRGVFEKLGYTVSWNKNTQTAILSNNKDRITIRNGSFYIYVNAKAVKPDVPQIIINGKMYIPLRAITEAVSSEVNWDSAKKTVNIKTSEKVVTLDEITSANTLENILRNYSSITINTTYKSIKSNDIAKNFEISFGKDEKGKYIYTYSDSTGLKRLMCYDGQYAIAPDGRTTAMAFKNDIERSNSIMDCYSYVDSNMMIASSENGTMLSLKTFRNSYKADVAMPMEISFPTYEVWSEVWGITDKKFDICYEYVLDKDTLAVMKTDIFCSLLSGRFDAGSTTIEYNKKIEIPDEFKNLIEESKRISI